jgi:hypothetical protein
LMSRIFSASSSRFMISDPGTPMRRPHWLNASTQVSRHR